MRYDSVYVEAFMDTIEILLNTYPAEITEFDNFYEDVMDQLEDTPYDSVITINADFFLIKGLEELKNAELRLAVIDRYRSESKTTYEVVSSTYPGYLRTLNDSAVTNHDLKHSVRIWTVAWKVMVSLIHRIPCLLTAWMSASSGHFTLF